MRSAILCVLVLAGCTSTQRISESSGDIRTEAHALIMHGKEIQDNEVVVRASRIDKFAEKIATQVANVQDKTPAWMTMLTYMAIAVVCVAVVAAYKAPLAAGLVLFVTTIVAACLGILDDTA